ncbi:hypothetical protein Acy02nite_68880 [Actinoplanes cyaneus]|uniref:Uncharacterized protein n=1 Tax=Actinoplanes cyaneus TaxID=52696 RepID=A0A919M7P9_9ACTN|nr:hypothetical protein Acy02nite_68880 [Actinoplanes cyaneus]
MSTALNPQTLPAALRTKLAADLADHIAAAPSPRDGVLAAIQAARAEALRNGWKPTIANAIGELVGSMGETAIGQPVLAIEAAIRSTRAAEREAERFRRRAMENGNTDAAARWAVKLAAARSARIDAEAAA